MQIEMFAVDTLTVATIVAMAAGTYLTRAGGFWLMGYVKLSPRIERFLRTMACGVLISIVTASVIRGDGPLWLGLGIVVAGTLALRRPTTALAIGMIATIAFRYFGY